MQVLSEYDYTVVLTSDTDKTKEMEHCMRLVRSGAVQGVIVHGSFVNDPLIARLVEEDVQMCIRDRGSCVTDGEACGDARGGCPEDGAARRSAPRRCPGPHIPTCAAWSPR